MYFLWENANKEINNVVLINETLISNNNVKKSLSMFPLMYRRLVKALVSILRST